MPPKGSTKRKAETPEQQETTPKKKSTKGSSTKKVVDKSPANDETPTKKPVKKAAHPKKAKEVIVYGKLSGDKGMSTPIDVKFEGDLQQSIAQQEGHFIHKLLLEAPGSFSLVKTILIEEGEYAGLQAIFLQPAKAFKFLELPERARYRVYDYYFAHNGNIGDSIAVEARRPHDKDLYAKAYSGGSRYRVALLAVCSKIFEESQKVFYSRPIRFENTSVLLDFLAQTKPNIVKSLHHVEITNFIKTSGRTALSFLAEASNLRTLTLTNGVSHDADPTKAAKNFDAEAHKFLEAMSVARRNDPVAAVDVLEFGPNAFVPKNEGKAWDEETLEVFKEELVARLK